MLRLKKKKKEMSRFAKNVQNILFVTLIIIIFLMLH